MLPRPWLPEGLNGEELNRLADGHGLGRIIDEHRDETRRVLVVHLPADLPPVELVVWHRVGRGRHTDGDVSVGQFVARTATEVHGGMGFTDLLGLHYWFKRIGFNRQMLGAPELVREEAARVQGLVS